MSTVLSPTTASERIDVIDQLRGFAIFGILVVNTFYFFNPFFAPQIGETASQLDRVAHGLINFLFLAKFYTLFSFLFGLGLHLQMSRAAARGRRIGPIFLRRLLILAALGLAHGTLLWVGDILLTYAVAGLLLFWWFRDRSPRTLKIWAIVLLCGLVAFLGAGIAAIQAVRLAPPETGAWERIEADFAAAAQRLEEKSDRDLEVYGTGGYPEITRRRWSDYLSLLRKVGLWMLPSVLAMFLLGLRAGKRGWFAAAAGDAAGPPGDEQAARARRILRWALAPGLLLNLYVAATGFEQNRLGADMLTWQTFFQVAALTFGSVLLALSWVALAILASRTGRGRRALAPLGPVGRMALSNYLLQSLVMTTLAYGYGLALFGKVDHALGLALAVAFFALQLPLSRWWFGRFRYGPVEWLWRALTYGRRP